MSPAIIRHYGDLKNTRNLQGEEVQRQEYLFLSSHNQWYYCMPYDNHFLYKSHRQGASVLCTCGASAVTVGYHVYKKWISYHGNEILVCSYHMQQGRHSDGSH